MKRRMKYLGLHKILWALLVLVVLIIEIFFLGSYYMLYVMWNLEIPHDFWLEFHSDKSLDSHESFADKNPVQTFLRRYKLVFD